MIGKHNIEVHRNVMKTSNHKYNISTYSYPQLRMNVIKVDAPENTIFYFFIIRLIENTKTELKFRIACIRSILFYYSLIGKY